MRNLIVAALAVTTAAAHAAKKPQAKFDPPDLNL
jgi:hypothetical protein